MRAPWIRRGMTGSAALADARGISSRVGDAVDNGQFLEYSARRKPLSEQLFGAGPLIDRRHGGRYTSGCFNAASRGDGAGTPER